MEYKKLLMPGFINRIDRQLLKNNPVSWSTRIHLALYYGVAFAIFITGLCFVVPDDARNSSTIYNWIIILSIISLLAFVFWMVYLLRFNVFKRFGKWNSLDTVKTFFFYFIITLVIISWPFIPPVVQSIRANAAYTSEELVKDINAMNAKLCLLERDSLGMKFDRDTFQVSNHVVGSVRTTDNYEESDEVVNKYGFYLIDTAVLRNKLSNADSVNKINDSVYIFYDCPKYDFIYNYALNDVSNPSLLTSMDLFRQNLQHPVITDKAGLEQELLKLFSKYSWRHTGSFLKISYDDYPLMDDTYISNPEKLNKEKIADKYDLYYVSKRIDNITDKKFRWDEGTIAVCWRVAYYISLALALLVLIYRHTTRRTFFLSWLTAVVLSILTGLFLTISFSNDGAFFTWFIFYFILFSVISATIITAGKRRVFAGIALNLLVFITPCLPLVLTTTYYQSLRLRYDYNFQNEAERLRYNSLFVNESLHYFLAEISGFILILVLLASLYQVAYKKWYSLPEL